MDIGAFPHTKKRSVLASVAALGVAALLLGACSAAAPSAEDSELAAVLDPAVRGADWQAQHFSELYAQDIEWEQCGEEEGVDAGFAKALKRAGIDLAEVGCGMVAAPLDWNNPDSDETIELAVVHVPATGKGERLGTLLGNPGGPGAGGVDFMLGMALSPGFDKITERYDLLGFDPRGIGGSTPLDCDSGTSEILEVQIANCVTADPLARTMGTVQVARDMELLRHLIGEERLDYLGYSYGTMLGATYASVFPERVGRMVLDSAENAEWASPIHRFDQEVAFAKALVALATACRTEYQDEVEVCPFESEDSLLEVIDRLNAEPLIATDGTEITGSALYGYLSNALYQSHFERGRTLDTVGLALFGNQDAIDVIGAEVADGGDGDMAMTMVTCHSFPIDPDIPGLLKHIRKEGVPRLLGGPEITDEVIAPFVDLSCYALPESGLDYTDRFDAASADPILVIGITGDHATPYQYAEVLTEELGNATLLTLEGQGHAASYSARSSCVDDAVSKYLLDGTMPKPGTVCTDD